MTGTLCADQGVEVIRAVKPVFALVDLPPAQLVMGDDDPGRPLDMVPWRFLQALCQEGWAPLLDQSAEGVAAPGNEVTR
jgi:hypothetical protein